MITSTFISNPNICVSFFCSFSLIWVMLLRRMICQTSGCDSRPPLLLVTTCWEARRPYNQHARGQLHNYISFKRCLQIFLSLCKLFHRYMYASDLPKPGTLFTVCLCSVATSGRAQHSGFVTIADKYSTAIAERR